MKIVTKEYFMTKTAEKSLGLPNDLIEKVFSVADKYHINKDLLVLCRKGYDIVKKDDFIPGERAVISYITTGRIDRDRDVVCPDGINLDDYSKTPVVVWAHNYTIPPIGKCQWIKKDKPLTGLLAKTEYAKHKLANTIYDLRKDGFALGHSIGIIPVVTVTKDDNNFNCELKQIINNNWIKEHDADKVKRIIKESILLEYSECTIPANPDALQIAVSKGLMSKDEYEDELKHIKEFESFINTKTIVQVDGLEQFEVNEENKEVKTEKDAINEENKIEVAKTNTPPTELIDSTKNITINVEQKIKDKKGNPSVNDIYRGINSKIKAMREQLDAMAKEKGISIKYENGEISSYMAIEDLYPVDYPNGHVVCGYAYSYTSPVKFYNYEYQYVVGSGECEIGKMSEVDISYVSKGICQGHIDKVNKNKELTTKFSDGTLQLEDLQNVPSLPLIFNSKILDKENNVIGLVTDKNDNLYQTRFDTTIFNGALYLEQKTKQAKEHFAKFVSIEPKSKEDWEVIQQKLGEFFLISAPGKEEILNFCTDNGLQHKDYIESDEVIIEKGVEETENEIRIRVQDPNLFDQDSFRYKTIKASKPRVKAVFGKKKGKTAMELQSYRFPREDGWIKAEAVKWVKEHNKKMFEYSEDEDSIDILKALTASIEQRNKELPVLIIETLAKFVGKAQI